jgi:hypothetical protein
VLSPPASYMGLACQDGYIALRCKNFELYDNLRKISSNLDMYSDSIVDRAVSVCSLLAHHDAGTETRTKRDVETRARLDRFGIIWIG